MRPYIYAISPRPTRTASCRTKKRATGKEIKVICMGKQLELNPYMPGSKDCHDYFGPRPAGATGSGLAGPKYSA